MIGSCLPAAFFCLLITFANSLDADQDRQNVGPDLDPTCLTLLTVFLKELFESVDFGSRLQRACESFQLTKSSCVVDTGKSQTQRL